LVPGAGDGAERLDHLVAAHADAVILDGKGAFVGIDGERDARLGVITEECRVADGIVAHLLVGIGRVRDQLAQKHRFVRIDRVHHEVEELGDIGLECAAFGAGLLRCSHGQVVPGNVLNHPPDGKNVPRVQDFGASCCPRPPPRGAFFHY
jgi:hypothetical protein